MTEFMKDKMKHFVILEGSNPQNEAGTCNKPKEHSRLSCGILNTD